MKIALAQCKSFPGDVAANTKHHLQLIEKAIALKADAVFFPELSLTAYEPALAERLAFDIEDPRLTIFADKSLAHQLSIGVGVPLRQSEGVAIGMAITHPSGSSQAYLKEYLHDDEINFFSGGLKSQKLQLGGIEVAMAICYELSLDAHLQQAVTANTAFYIASVAKHQKGIVSGNQRLSEIASRFRIPAMMVNAIGMADGMLCVGQSSVWNAEGNMIGQLGESEEGILLYDSVTDSTTTTLL